MAEFEPDPEIRADILTVEGESEGLLDELLKGARDEPSSASGAGRIGHLSNG